MPYSQKVWAGIAQISIATRCGLAGPVIESWLGRDFPQPSRQFLEPIQPPVHGFWVISEGATAWTWRWSPTPSSADVKERV